jgi:hypothetical protein
MRSLPAHLPSPLGSCDLCRGFPARFIRERAARQGSGNGDSPVWRQHFVILPLRVETVTGPPRRAGSALPQNLRRLRRLSRAGSPEDCGRHRLRDELRRGERPPQHRYSFKFFAGKFARPADKLLTH